MCESQMNEKQDCERCLIRPATKLTPFGDVLGQGCVFESIHRQRFHWSQSYETRVENTYHGGQLGDVLILERPCTAGLDLLDGLW